MNKHLVEEHKKVGLWSKEMKDLMVKANGSVQSIIDIPTNIKELYKTVWEMSQKVIIDMAADRGVFIDQSQSMNLFVESPTLSKLSSMHFYAWKAGLKTGMYYLRSKPAATAVKVTVNQDQAKKTEAIAQSAQSASPDLKVVEGEVAEAKPQVECTDEVCLVCSA